MSRIKIAELGGIAANLGQVTVPAGNDLRIGQAGTIDHVGNGAMQLPTGNTSSRPSSPVAGFLGFKTVTNLCEYYTGSTWSTF